ncbi:LacI family DNA-binding transcriptional regulator [Pilimelia columellifera]|uniref:HTH lacI-type domain-containing protein n=1 Tax=Pilimelia columellifera subsp. columellifera TaxID=706583 RepID=A0ABN3NNY1_9ACTN
MTIEPGAGAPTMEQVAARAGVGRGTVSRVINGSARVSSRARAAVERAIAELGYRPSPAGRHLATGRSNLAALVLRESGTAALPDALVAGVVRGAAKTLNGAGWSMLVVAGGSDEPGPPHVAATIVIDARTDATDPDGTGAALATELLRRWDDTRSARSDGEGRAAEGGREDQRDAPGT